MTIHDRQALRQTADARIAQATYAPRRLVLISSGVSFGVALLVAVLNHLLYRQVNLHGGGLSGMELRIMLETAATVLQYAQLIFVPFWSMGLFSSALRIARSEPAEPGNLLDGFRRFGPVLRVHLLQVAIYMLIALACSYTGSFLFMMTPFALPMVELLEPMLNLSTPEQMEAFLLSMDQEALMKAMLPALILIGLMCIGLMIPAFYRMRLANYIIMDEPRVGAFAAVRTSFRYLRRNCVALLRVDLTFWPYYLLTALAMPLAYLDQLLPRFNMDLPMSEDALFFLGYGLYILVSLVLQVWMLHRVRVTEALVYEMLKPKEIKENV